MTEDDVIDHALATPLPVARMPRRMQRLRSDVRSVYLSLEGLSESAPNSAPWHDHLRLLESSVSGLVRTVGEQSTRRIMARIQKVMLIQRRQTQALLPTPSDSRSSTHKGQHPRRRA